MESRKILIIEDNDDYRKSLEDVLAGEGFQVIGVHDGYGGLAQLSMGLVPGLIITDVHMPALDGFQFLKELRKNSQYWRVPVLICTEDDRFKDLSIHLGDVRSTGKDICKIISMVHNTRWN